jgi:8-oxo-dGTP diphosphatase
MKKRRIIPVVLGIISNGKGEFLLSQRNSPENPTTHQRWQLVGGGLEFGETPEQTLVREFEEEIRCTPKLLHPHPIVKTSSWDNPKTKEFPDTQLLLIAYIVSIGSHTPDFSQDKETLDARWFTLEQALAEKVLPQTHEFLLEAQNSIRNKHAVELAVKL